MLEILIIILVVIADQVTKQLTNAYIALGADIPVLGELLRFTHITNDGAAMGILSGQRWIFISATIVMIAVLSYALFKKKVKGKLGVICTALIIGGGIGNLIDRILIGNVVDFIKLIYFPYIFNVADMCVTIGAILGAVWLMFLGGDIDVGKKNPDSGK